MHLASPVVLVHGAAVARRAMVLMIAQYQTDLPSYARADPVGRLARRSPGWLRGIDNGAARRLAPSTVTATGLLGQGIENVWLWGRGVETAALPPGQAQPADPGRAGARR